MKQNYEKSFSLGISISFKYMNFERQSLNKSYVRSMEILFPALMKLWNNADWPTNQPTDMRGHREVTLRLQIQSFCCIHILSLYDALNSLIWLANSFLFCCCDFLLQHSEMISFFVRILEMSKSFMVDASLLLLFMMVILKDIRLKNYM